MASYTEDTREQALTQLMHLYGDSIKRMCGVYLRDMGMADDAAQETFIKAYDHIDEWLDGEINNEKAWLMRIAINTCKDTLRSSWMRHIDRQSDHRSPSPIHHAEQRGTAGSDAGNYGSRAQIQGNRASLLLSGSHAANMRTDFRHIRADRNPAASAGAEKTPHTA